MINAYRRTYRSGYQVHAPDNITADKQMILMEITLPKLIKNTGIYGSMNGANGHNGHEKDHLYVATYLNSEGVGNERK